MPPARDQEGSETDAWLLNLNCSQNQNYFPEMFTFWKFWTDKQYACPFCVTNPIPRRNSPYAPAGIPFISRRAFHTISAMGFFYLIAQHLLIIDRAVPQKKHKTESCALERPGFLALICVDKIFYPFSRMHFNGGVFPLISPTLRSCPMILFWLPPDNSLFRLIETHLLLIPLETTKPL